MNKVFGVSSPEGLEQIPCLCPGPVHDLHHIRQGRVFRYLRLVLTPDKLSR